LQPGNIIVNEIIVLRMIRHGAEPHATWAFCCDSSRDSAGSHQRVTILDYGLLDNV